MRVVYRTPKLFTHAGVYLHLWGKWYRIIKVGDR